MELEYNEYSRIWFAILNFVEEEFYHWTCVRLIRTEVESNFISSSNHCADQEMSCTKCMTLGDT